METPVPPVLLPPGEYVVAHRGDCWRAVRVRLLEGLEGYTAAREQLSQPIATCPVCARDGAECYAMEAWGALNVPPVGVLTPAEYLRGTAGLPLPWEGPVTVDTVSRVLREVPVRRILGRDTPLGVAVEALVLWDGTEILFGTRNAESIVCRVVPPRGEEPR